MRLLLRSVLLATAVWSVAPPLALAQVDSREGIALQNEIYQLRQELRQMQERGGYGGGQTYQTTPRPGGSSSDLLTQLLTRVDSLEDQVRQLRGRVDEVQNEVQQQSVDLNKKIGDLKFQIDSGAGGQAPQKAQGALTSPPPAPLTPPAASAKQTPAETSSQHGPRTPERAMQEGRLALAHHDYSAAADAAREVLANRTSPRAYDAKLLLAQALEGEKKYPQAAVAFDDAYNLSRKGSHAQDALVGLAASLAAINEKKAACDTLNRLHADFSSVRADLKSQVAATSQKAGCR